MNALRVLSSNWHKVFDKCCLAKVIFTYYIYLIVDESAARDKNRYSGEKNALVSAYFFFCNPFEVARHACRSAPNRLSGFPRPFPQPHLPCSHHRQVRGCGVHGAYGGISSQHNLLACGASVCLLTAHP